ncbi:hypothetical protein CONPUDRAFT_79341 [Coniophora puteana RWD-64-598 SS2]|uniref:HNH nuclease domain-containing protein n=1 Tax=Coniophora puteana (strain RWD-64-598) TaxID=741705 RepID=A0A5M3N789_CONPW|nr:uncharacterized protein CONPUDRAFT_79341 [Coniophora puteana RWD-64-598 SS2]EIW87186.1 hypothetical protein CONPUDRAFT_79341 [Coniophora puteana RWD-64-598 SS2]
MGGFQNDYPRQTADNREVQSCSDTATSADELYGLTQTPSFRSHGILGLPARRRRPGLHTNIKKARQLDPNQGRCAITGRRTNVVSCHMLPLNTDDTTLSQLEWAWGVGWRRLDVTSPYNTLFVGAEWKPFFDSGDCFLIPELPILRALRALAQRQTAKRRIKLNKTLRGRTIFKYYFIASSSLEDAIISVESAHRTRAVHPYPFATLSPIFSHVRPQFVMRRMQDKFKKSHGELSHALKEVLAWQESLLSEKAWYQHTDTKELAAMTASLGATMDIVSAGSAWMSCPNPRAFKHRLRASRRYERVCGSLSLVTCSSTDNSALTNLFSPTLWPEKRQNVYMWLAHANREAADTGWESVTLNDEQVANFNGAEPSLTPLAEDEWHNWRPWWYRQKVTRKDSRQFSSNDWAALEFHVYLPVY